jgi:hypothetical protein
LIHTLERLRPNSIAHKEDSFVPSQVVTVTGSESSSVASKLDQSALVISVSDEIDTTILQVVNLTGWSKVTQVALVIPVQLTVVV